MRAILRSDDNEAAPGPVPARPGPGAASWNQAGARDASPAGGTRPSPGTTILGRPYIPICCASAVPRLAVPPGRDPIGPVGVFDRPG